MSRFKPADPLDRLFEIGIILKGLDGLLETIGGLLLLAVTPATINQLAAARIYHIGCKVPASPATCWAMRTD